MEKKEAAAAGDSICQKLFKAFVPTRRLSFRKQEPQPPKAAAAAAFMEEGKMIKIQNVETPPAPHPKADKPKRNNSLNERAENYIARTKLKLRIGSAVGRHAS